MSRIANLRACPKNKHIEVGTDRRAVRCATARPAVAPYHLQGNLLSGHTLRKWFNKAGARMALLIHLNDAQHASLCLALFLDGKDLDVRVDEIPLDGTLSDAAIQARLRRMGWRASRSNPCYVVMRSEDALLWIEEFPSVDPVEIRAMADGRLQGMIELESEFHGIACEPLHRGDSFSVCALSIFKRARVEPILEWAGRLGLGQPRFVMDALAGARTEQDGSWAWVVRRSPSRALLCSAKVDGGVARTFHQRIYNGMDADASGKDSFAREIFGNATGLPVQWRVACEENGLSRPLEDFARLAMAGSLVSFECHPASWIERLQRERTQRTQRQAIGLAAACYAGFLCYLAATTVNQKFENTRLQQSLHQQEKSFVAAMDAKRDLARAGAGANESGNVLEMMRQIGEPMPEGVTLESFTYHFQDSLKLRGTASDGETIYDFVARLRENHLFRGTRVESIAASGKGVSWQVIAPLQAAPRS